MRYFLIILSCLLFLSSSIIAVDLEELVESATKDTTKTTQKAAVAPSDKIKEILIKGHQTVELSRIEQQIILSKGDKFHPLKLNRSVKNIQSMGVFASVKTDVLSSKTGKRVTFILKENPVISEIKLVGNTVYSNEEIKDILYSKENKILNINNVRKDIQAIENLYKDNGYFLVKIFGVKTPEKAADPLQFKISEGILEEIIITGNTRTKEYVILREMNLELNKPLNENVLQKDLRKIYNLNYFSKLEPDFLDGSTVNSYKLKLEIEEKQTGTLNFGGGYGQRSGLFIYSDLYVDNVFGTGQLVGLQGQWGRQATSYRFKYFNPWAFGERRSFLFKTWKTEGSFGYNPLTTNFRQEDRVGAFVQFGLPYSYELRTTHGFKVENITFPDTADENLGSGYYIQSYTFGTTYDTRDVRFNPREGYFHTYSMERGFKVAPKSLNFTKHDLTLSKFTPTFEKQTIATRLILGKLYGETEPSELYFVGGPNTVRGYEEFPNSFANGTSRIIANIEYRFLFNDIFQALAFIDAGWAPSLGSKRYAKVGKGVGFRIQSPLGPIRLDFGVDDQSEIRVHFNIGHVF